MTVQNQPHLKQHEHIEYVQREMLYAGLIINCANCEHSDMDKSVCRKYNAQPPMKVIVKGCESWELHIPF